MVHPASASFYARAVRLYRAHTGAVILAAVILFLVVLIVSLSLPGKNRRPVTYFEWSGGRHPDTGEVYYGDIDFSKFGSDEEYWWPELVDDDPRIKEIHVTGVTGHPQSRHGGIVIIEYSDPSTLEMWLYVPGTDLEELIHVRYPTQQRWDWWWDHTKTRLWNDETWTFAPSGASRFFRGVGISLWYTFLLGLLLVSLVLGVVLIPAWIWLGGNILMQSSSIGLQVVGNVLTVVGGIATVVLLLPIVLSIFGASGTAESLTAMVTRLGGGLFCIKIWRD